MACTSQSIHPNKDKSVRDKAKVLLGFKHTQTEAYKGVYKAVHECKGHTKALCISLRKHASKSKHIGASQPTPCHTHTYTHTRTHTCARKYAPHAPPLEAVPAAEQAAAALAAAVESAAAGRV
eukprot:scaffold20958_cov18-Tisochrysis_lutea.AAC.2